MASQRKSVYEQLIDPQANSNPIFDNRRSNLIYRDESIIKCGNGSHFENVIDYQSNYDKPIKIQFSKMSQFLSLSF